MPRHLARALLLALSLTAFATARAQSAAPAPAPLTLEDCIARAMKRNFDLQIQNFSTDIAKENLNIAKAGFDPVISASLGRNLTQASSTTSTLDGTTAVGPRTDNTSGSVG